MAEPLHDHALSRFQYGIFGPRSLGGETGNGFWEGVLSYARHPIVHGYVADDRLMQIIDDYENGDLTIEEVERRLANAPFRAFQYSFHTPEALATLTFKEVLK